MPNTTNSQFMNLPVPVVTVDPGPQYAVDVNTCLTLIDSHDHTTGKGAPINPSGININADLPFNGYNATLLRSTRFSAQGSPLATASDLGCVYVSGVDLYFNDVNGNQIRMTQSGSIAGSPGNITGLVSPASVSYSSGSQTFTFLSSTSTAANIDAASYLLRNTNPSSNAITISAPNVLPSSYTMTMPQNMGSSGFVLQSDGVSNTSWQSKTSYRTIKISSDYTARPNDDVILASSAASGTAYVITLPASSGMFFKNTKIIRTDGNLLQNLIISSTGGKTIQGSPSVYLSTMGEAYDLNNDGSGSYVISNHRTETAWASYSPNIFGFGTVTSTLAFWRRSGDSIFLNVSFTTGTTQANTAAVTLPTGANIDFSLWTQTNQLVGAAAGNAAGAAYYTIITSFGASTAVFFGNQGAGNASLAVQNGNGVFGNTVAAAFMTTPIPISNWTA